MGCSSTKGVVIEPQHKTVIQPGSSNAYPVAPATAVYPNQQSHTSYAIHQMAHGITATMGEIGHDMRREMVNWSEQHMRQNGPYANLKTNLPDAPKSSKRKDSSSSSSDSDSSIDLEKKRKEIKEQKAVLTKDVLLRYNALSVVIYQLERKNITLKLEEKLRLSTELKIQAKRLNVEYSELGQKTNKELQDVQNLQSLATGTNVFKYFENQAHFDTQLSKEQEEYIQAKTEMEDCYKRIAALQSRQSVIESEIATLNVDNQELQKHYKEQEEILDSIFDGAYGSDLEDQLENDLDRKLEKKQRIELVYQRWKEADASVKQASSQLNYAFDRWQSIQRISFTSMQNRMVIVQVAAQARSYLIAASQNLSSAHQILRNVKFPYCDKQEIQTLNKAISYIFLDVQTKERHQHAGDVYKTTRDRCFVLSQWMNHVIKTNLEKDVEASRKECAELSAKLRTERTRLMREKIEEETGQKVAFDEEPDSGIESEGDHLAPAPAEAEKLEEDNALDEKIKEAEQDVAEGEDGETANITVVAKPVPLPLDELAPTPKQDELFGDLEVVMAQYDKQRDDYAKEMEANRARQHADFQMKLQARRSRKRRMMALKQEVDEMRKKDEELAAIEVPKSE